MMLTGAIRAVATLQEAAAVCRTTGFDILHYIPEESCRSLLRHNAATRDVNAGTPPYTVTCQRK